MATKPSTRNRILHQMKKVVESVAGVPWHLQNMEELADGRSEHLNHYIPLIVKLNEEYLKVLLELQALL